MVKRSIEPVDHIGWDLWRASQAWKRRLVAGMVAKGHVWFGEARGNIVHHISASGVRQGEIVGKSQLSKQAVQQFLDELERDGIVKRSADPDDARARVVTFTAKGLKALEDATAIKLGIERELELVLGKSQLSLLKSALDKITTADQ
jgi:DNA-binding MarR family transcriptional regulator